MAIESAQRALDASAEGSDPVPPERPATAEPESPATPPERPATAEPESAESESPQPEIPPIAPPKRRLIASPERRFRAPAEGPVVTPPPAGATAPSESRGVPSPEPATTASPEGTRLAIGVDVGGSGIKVALVDTTTGDLRSERIRVATPNPSTPDRVGASIGRIVRRLVRAGGIPEEAPVGVGLPGVAIDGRLLTAANIDPGWIDYPIAERLAKALKRRVEIVNDADAAGIAEMRFGVGAGKAGTVIFLTLGTGVGSGVFVDGKLVPNTEFGQMEIRGRPAERRSASAARTKRGLSWKAWAQDLDEHLQRIDDLMWPTLFIIGGGVSKNADRFIPRLTVRTPVVPAELRNDAGIIGAAVVAVEGLHDAGTTWDDLPEGKRPLSA